MRVLSKGILETGDGVVHYQMARYSWQHPEVFLDLWGKPMFTILSSPFAQFGHWGMTLFNALCFVGTAWAADGLLKKAGTAARWLFPPALLLIPVYGTMIIAGMTEVLFGLLTVLAIRAAYEDKPVIMALVVSVMPFSRPEFIGFLPFAILWLLWGRNWRALPWLITGHALYAFFAWLYFGDPLWAIRGDPYKGAADIYGSGPFGHFIDHLKFIYGRQVLYATALAVIVLLWARFREFPTTRLLVLLALLPTLSIFLLHSVLWWKGWKGSFGLLRVLATTAPMLTLFSCWMVVRVASELLRMRGARFTLAVGLGTLYLFLACKAFLKIRPLPVPHDKEQAFLNSVSERLVELRNDGTRVSFDHPYIGYKAGVDPFSWNERAYIDKDRADLGLNDGDMIVWDAHYSANEGRMPLHWFTGHPELIQLDRMAPEEPVIVLGGHELEIYFFERRNSGTANE